MIFSLPASLFDFVKVSYPSNPTHSIWFFEARQAVRITAEDFIIKPCLPKSKTVMHSIKIKLPLLVPMKRTRERRINFKLKGEIYKIINFELAASPLNTTIVDGITTTTMTTTTMTTTSTVDRLRKKKKTLMTICA